MSDGPIQNIHCEFHLIKFLFLREIEILFKRHGKGLFYSIPDHGFKVHNNQS